MAQRLEMQCFRNVLDSVGHIISRDSTGRTFTLERGSGAGRLEPPRIHMDDLLVLPGANELLEIFER